MAGIWAYIAGWQATSAIAGLAKRVGGTDDAHRAKVIGLLEDGKTMTCFTASLPA